MLSKKLLKIVTEIKLLDFKIERTMLEIKESTFDKKNTELVEKQSSKQKIMVLENQKSDVIDENKPMKSQRNITT
jgi:hypothetical protein